MIQNCQRQMRVPIGIRLDQDPISRHRAWDTMLQLASCREDQILVTPARVRAIGLTHGHVPPQCPPPIDVMHNCPAARLWHERFQADDVMLDPHWLRLGEDVTGW